VRLFIHLFIATGVAHQELAIVDLSERRAFSIDEVPKQPCDECTKGCVSFPGPSSQPPSETHCLTDSTRLDSLSYRTIWEHFLQLSTYSHVERIPQNVPVSIHRYSYSVETSYHRPYSINTSYRSYSTISRESFVAYYLRSKSLRLRKCTDAMGGSLTSHYLVDNRNRKNVQPFRSYLDKAHA
jgi:hypothetical protein